MRAGEALTARASGKIRLGRRSFSLKTVSKRIGANSKDVLTLRTNTRSQARIVRALKSGKRAKAIVKVRLSDGAGNVKTKTLRITLR